MHGIKENIKLYTKTIKLSDLRVLPRRAIDSFKFG